MRPRRDLSGGEWLCQRLAPRHQLLSYERHNMLTLFGISLFGANVQLAGWNDEPGAQSAVGMHAQHLQVLATIPPAAPAGKAALAVDVRLDGATVARLEIGHSVADRDDFYAKLMAENPRVSDERHLAQIATQLPTSEIGAGVHEDDCSLGVGPLRAIENCRAGRAIFRLGIDVIQFQAFNRADSLGWSERLEPCRCTNAGRGGG